MDTHTHSSSAFDDIPRNARGQLTLYFYAAVLQLIQHIEELNQVGGPPLEKMYERYPFLGKYGTEIQKFHADSSSWQQVSSGWFDAIRAWERTADRSLPFSSLSQQEGQSFDSTLAFAIVGLIEEDSRFGTVFAELQAPLVERRPSVELIGRLLATHDGESPRDGWAICRPLISDGLIEVMNPQAPRSEWTLRVPSELWDAARGEVERHSAPAFKFYPWQSFPAIDELIHPPELIAHLSNVPALMASSQIDSLVLRADAGTDTLEVIGAIARSQALNVYYVHDGSGAEEAAHLLGPLCTMANAIPVFRYESAPGDTIKPPLLRGYSGPVGILLGGEGGLDNRSVGKSLTLSLQAPDQALRTRHWLKALQDTAAEGLDEIVRKYHIAGGYVRDLAGIAVANARLNGRRTVTLGDVQEASRSLNRQNMDTLADRLPASGSWDDLVVTTATADKLFELERRCEYREQLIGELSPAFANSINRGVRALFAGASGTGKTLAAKILASELGMDLYRVDLAAVINKYIGETEKNLHQVLSRAEALDVILLLDEGDALLGGRTDVKSANDRYANLETNYLLQRLENYQGIVLVTSNLVENIDRAFQRRMDVVVPFYLPQPEQRMRILELHLPIDHEVDFHYLQHVASRCVLTGGQIRNATLHASLLAMEEGHLVDRFHLEAALKSEFRKAGAISPLKVANNHALSQNGSMEAFVSALANNH